MTLKIVYWVQNVHYQNVDYQNVDCYKTSIKKWSSARKCRQLQNVKYF